MCSEVIAMSQFVAAGQEASHFQATSRRPRTSLNTNTPPSHFLHANMLPFATPRAGNVPPHRRAHTDTGAA